MSTTTVKQAANESGISESTIYRRLKDSDFSKRYYQARMDMLKNHVAALHGYLGGAIETMGQVMESKDSPPQTRLNAAEAVIRNCMKLTEDVDFEERLRSLEARLQETEE